MRWRLLPHSAPALHFWQGECVVHHALSNDTHRITEPAGRLLLELATAGVDDAVDPGWSLALSRGDVEVLLESLAALGLAEQC
jgi:hypothetical protein